MTMVQTQPRSKTSRKDVERAFRTFDGAQLFYRAWLPPDATDKALVLFHRGHEHSGRFEEMVEKLGLRDVAVFAWDARGHGQSPGERGFAESVGTFVRDADAFVRFITCEHQIPLENMIVLGHSVGAVLVAAWVHDYAPPVRAMILATPALRVKLYVPFARPALRLRTRFGGKSFVKSYVKSRMLTHDREQARLYDADPLISRQIAVNILLDLHDTSTRLIDDAGSIRTPALVLTCGSDWVVKNSATRRFFQRLGSPMKELHHFDGFSHAIFHESSRDLPIRRVKEFIGKAFTRPSDARLRIEPDPHSQLRFERLGRPSPRLCPKRLSLAAQGAFLKTVGRLSNGIRLGWRSGFSSGRSLDYVYSNRAGGITPLGKLIDRIYLNSPGWRGIRQRKANLKTLLNRALDEQLASGKLVHIVDVASGPGRYLLELLAERPKQCVFATLRDREASALAEGRRLAGQMTLNNVSHVAGDAFDEESLATIRPRPDVVVVSGIYELFPDNTPVLRSLRGIARAVPRGGYLIYTNQPWHPQLEMIGGVLIHGDGSPWIMRCRPQREMDDLVRAVGFEKEEMLVDEQGIFTVSLARRI